MKNWKSTAVLVALLSTLLIAPSGAQKAAPPPPGRVVISIYHIAPGKHLDFLKWMAEREAVDKEVGAAATQVYAHIDGDSWDFLAITPQLDGAAQAELDKKVEAASKKKGVATGPKAALEIRQYLASHTDTFAAGPMTAAQMIEAVK